MPEQTLEQLQEEVINLRSTIDTLTAERDSLTNERDTLTADLNNARKLNSQLLERITEPEKDDTPPEPEAPNWGEIAKSIPIK